MNVTINNYLNCILIFAISLMVFCTGLNILGFEFRDDEMFYFKSTAEMLETGNVLSPKYFGENRFQKPILFYWLILVSYKIFHPGWFAARFVSSLFAASSLVVTWLMAKSLYNRKVANLSCIILMTCPLFFRHAKNAVPDMTLNFFIVLALYFFVRFAEDRSLTKYSKLFFVSCALGFMIKGFAAIIFPFVTVIAYALIMKEWKIIKQFSFLKGIGIMLLVVVPWFLYMIIVHGFDYLNYMWFTETTGRLLHVTEGNFVLVKLKTFFSHLLFYCQVFLQQYMPWSLFSVAGIVYAFKKIEKREGAETYIFLLVWIMSVFIFFSFMYFTISHYLLVLSTPVAILTSFFLLSPLESPHMAVKITAFLRKYLIPLIIMLITLVYTFILLFFASTPIGYVVFAWLIASLLMIFVIRSKTLFAAPVLLGLFMVGILVQAPFFSQLGLTNHTTLYKFAETINREDRDTYAIGVGSHDLHENEWQVYFPDVKVQKVANDNDQYTTYMIKRLFGNNERVYCLITEKDYNRYLKDIIRNTQIIQEEFMLRKRLNLDHNFVMALLRFDRQKIYNYFMENVVLVKREQNV